MTPQAPVLFPSPRDLGRWSVDLAEIARQMQAASGLAGVPYAWTPQLWFMGEATVDGTTVQVLLGLAPPPLVEDLVRSVPTHAPRDDCRWVVVVPGLALPPITLQAL